MEYSYFFYHYAITALVVSVNAISVGLGDGFLSISALQAAQTQPHAKPEIFRTLLLGLALIETTAVVGLVIGLMLFTTNLETFSEYAYYGQLGIGFAICFSGAVIGFVSAYPAREACFAVARQPFFGRKIQLLMLLTLSLMQTPIIFAFIIALLIKGQLAEANTLGEALRLIGSGVCIGVGSIGPALGLAAFSKAVCRSIGTNRQAYPQLFQFTLFSEALIESPLIFTFVVSIIILQMRTQEPLNFIEGIGFLTAGLCMGLGTVGPGIGSGNVASGAATQIALTPQHFSSIMRTSLLGQVLIETSAIYALIIAIIIIFR